MFALGLCSVGWGVGSGLAVWGLAAWPGPLEGVGVSDVAAVLGHQAPSVSAVSGSPQLLSFFRVRGFSCTAVEQFASSGTSQDIACSLNVGPADLLQINDVLLNTCSLPPHPAKHICTFIFAAAACYDAHQQVSAAGKGGPLPPGASCRCLPHGAAVQTVLDRPCTRPYTTAVA